MLNFYLNLEAKCKLSRHTSASVGTFRHWYSYLRNFTFYFSFNLCNRRGSSLGLFFEKLWTLDLEWGLYFNFLNFTIFLEKLPTKISCELLKNISDRYTSIPFLAVYVTFIKISRGSSLGIYKYGNKGGDEQLLKSIPVEGVTFLRLLCGGTGVVWSGSMKL